MSTATPAARPAPHHVPSFDADAFEAFLAARGEPGWLADRRRAAFAAFRAAAWPTLRDEEWRRTDIRALKLAGFAPPSGRAPSDAAVVALAPAWNVLAGHYAAGLMQIDGSVGRRSDVGTLPPGVVFTDLATAAREHPELLRRHLLTTAIDPNADLFSAFHAAFWTSGAFLYVPRGVALEAPLFHLIGLGPEGATDCSHTLVVLEEGASASLVQETASASGRATPGLHVGAVELIVGRNAHLRFVNIQNWDEQVWHFSRERAVVGRDASLQWTVGGLGSRLAKVNQEVALADQGARAQVNGVMFTTGRQNLTYLTRQDHQAPNTTSDLLYKAGLKDESRVVWKGMIRVEPGAQKTDAYQKNDNLILDESARADSIPGLEIEANDVRCTHGATAGPVDPDMVFYLTSRGISRETATRLIVEGFFANVYDRITLEPVRATFEKVVAAKLGTGS
jgi:Fe-S cluster assembly protein SufD